MNDSSAAAIPAETAGAVAVAPPEFLWNLVVKGTEADESVVALMRKRIDALEKHLQSFDPQAVYLHIDIEKNAHSQRYTVKMVLSLPEHLLASEKQHKELGVAASEAVKALIRQLEAVKARLRGEPLWKRKARREKLRFALLPQTAGQGPASITEAVARHHAQYDAELREFIERRLAAAGLSTNSTDDYLSAIRQSRQASSPGKSGRLSEKARTFRIALQQLRAAVPAATPAPVASTTAPATSLLELFDRLLASSEPFVREVFDLYYIAGFEPDDIAQITERPVKDVEQALAAIQNLLREQLHREALSV